MRALRFAILSALVIGVIPFASAQRPKKKEEAKPKAIKVDGIPEKFPTDPKAQRKWYLRWTVKNKMPVEWLLQFAGILQEDADNFKKAYETEKERSKPRKSVLRYYKKSMEWHEEQAQLITAIKALKLSQLPIKGSEAHKARYDEIDGELEEKIKDFRKLLSQRPEKPGK